MTDEKPWRDEELMRKLYHDKRMSQREISDHFDNEITPAGIGNCLDDLGIEKRSRSEAMKIRWSKTHVRPYTASNNGYEILRSKLDGDEDAAFHHRLLAVAKYGFDEVKGMVVHHKSGVEWDNRWSNIELMTEEEHARHHKTDEHIDKPWHDADRLRELRVEKEMTLEQVGNELGCCGQTIRRCLDEYNVGETAE